MTIAQIDVSIKGAIGTLIIVQPSYAIVDSISFIVLAVAVCYAISYRAGLIY